MGGHEAAEAGCGGQAVLDADCAGCADGAGWAGVVVARQREWCDLLGGAAPRKVIVVMREKIIIGCRECEAKASGPAAFGWIRRIGRIRPIGRMTPALGRLSCQSGIIIAGIFR